jgi:hypothetical protein
LRGTKTLGGSEGIAGDDTIRVKADVSPTIPSTSRYVTMATTALIITWWPQSQDAQPNAL